MPRDELRQPLRKRSLAQRLWAKRPSLFGLAVLLLAAGFLTGGLLLMRMPHPMAGEPVVVATIPPVEELATASINKVEDDPTALEEEEPATEDVIDQSAAEITVLNGTPSEESEQPDGQEEASIISARRRPLPPAPIAEVSEETETGPLPRVSGRGQKPFNVYSQATSLSMKASRLPKIAIVLGGMGLNLKLTGKALEELPADVTLGFAPYGDKLQQQVNAARADGHEILLQVPMEPVGYPAANPGPRTLLSDAPPQQNIESLRWHMSRFAGYSGITNYMGGRMLASEEAMKPVLAEVRGRGLVYLEDASVNLSAAPNIVGKLNLPMQRASVLIDSDPSGPAIADALQKLEQEAIRNGSAIGSGSGLDITIEMVAEWAKTLQEKGITLVPVSAIYRGQAG
jgi:polysaccharide deacetylase 2 family uncharacterized protein YibQ